jgi:arylsulfatase A-like enzyme
MASLFTSLNVETHQVYFATDPDAPDTSKSDVLPDKLPTLATWLKGAGYGTRAVQTNGNLAKEFGFANGYDDYVYEHDAPATRVTDLALDSLNRAAAGPLLLYAHYIDPHAPYVAPAKYVEMLGGLPPTLDVKERAVIDDFMPYFMDYSNFVLHKSARKFPELSDNGKEAVRLQYDAEARYLDDEIKRLVETIQRDRPNTIFIFLADHGESFWEHGFIGHGLTMYEEEIHIPLIVCGPGFDSRVIEKPVGTVGLLPTLAKRLSLDAMPAWQGRDWLSAETAPVYSYTLSPWKRCGREIEAVIEESPKLIRNCLTNEREFYCVSDDPGEHSNQLAIQTDAAQKLTVLLDEHRKANVAARTQTGSDKITLDDERLEELRSQGYIQVDSEDKKSR